jgi:hypothetical protein
MCMGKITVRMAIHYIHVYMHICIEDVCIMHIYIYNVNHGMFYRTLHTYTHAYTDASALREFHRVSINTYMHVLLFFLPRSFVFSAEKLEHYGQNSNVSSNSESISSLQST